MLASDKHLSESYARAVLAIGAYQELGLNPGFEEIARATNRSLSRVRSLIAELLKRKDLDLIRKVQENPVRLELTEKGWKVYWELKTALLGPRVNEKVEPHELNKLFDEKIYADNAKMKTLGSVIVDIDIAVPALKLRELINGLKETIGPPLLYGITLELATAVQMASASGISSVPFSALSRQVVNVPIRIARVTDVSLPPHIEGTIIPLDRAKEALKSLAVWPQNVTKRDILAMPGKQMPLAWLRWLTRNT